jgi:hypothetical protein
MQTNKTKVMQNNQLGKPTLVDTIVSNVKEKMDKNLQMYLLIVVPILLFLAYIFYKYNFDSRSANIITSMNYKKQIELTPMIPCYNLDIKQQYKLCDYYVSSSFMTPCVGNQHYDYVSNDMIAEVMQSGARYIQIPICEADVSVQALPVVGTAVYGQQLITSLNTLEIKSVLKTIRTNAFKLNKKSINYPLIVHLVLNTTNAFTLRTLADNISEVLSDVLIDVTKYKTFPIFLEKLCNLQGKIILFATPEYIGTKLEPFIVPTNKLFEIYHFGELGPLNMPSDNVYETPYNNKLSSKQQETSNAKFKAKYPTIDYILNNTDTIGNIIMNDKDILNNLTCFNKIGMTIVKPLFPEDVVSLNYDSSESIFYGCQFTTMNFQINDINMQNYLSIFKDSSFRLKPDSLRFSEVEEPMPDILKLYQSISQKDNSIINDFFYKYNNCLIAFESYTLQNTYLSQIEANLQFNVGSKQIKDKFGKVTYKIGINQCFIPRKSNISTNNNVSMYLESASMSKFFISMNSGLFDLNNLSKIKSELISQAFYVVKPKTLDNERDGEMVSIRTTDNNNPMYIACENKIVKAYANIIQIEAQNNMTFIVHKIPFKYVLKIITIFDGSLKTMGGNIIGALENNINNGTSYYVISTNPNQSNNFNIFKDQFFLQNTKTKTYVVYDPATFYLYDREQKPNDNSIFNIELSSGYYKILNVNNDNLTLVNNKIIKFAKEKNIVGNENLFKLDITYEIA